jgi:DNA-directed RNA polymerase subunit beta'
MPTAKDFNAIKLKLASPDDILGFSYGEVTKPETINYRTQRPEKDGLFSERIFGPTKDWECYCGKYRKIRYKGVVCDKCGVEVTRSIVRRERMGHITLATPVAHIWFFKNIPSKLSIILNVPYPQLEKVLYYASFIVTSVNEENRTRILEELDRELKARQKEARKDKDKDTLDALRQKANEIKKSLQGLLVGQVLSENEFYSLSKRFGEVFEADTGAEAIRRILEGYDLLEVAKGLKKDLTKTRDPLKERNLLRRLKLLTALHKNGMRPEWMVLTVLPILPPDLRPMVALDGGRYAASDLNDLYRRVINRNNRLKKLLDLSAPEVIIRNERRMLQEAVDALFDNSARFGSQQLSAQRRPLRSLADMLKGKQGRFRQNLLGKRVDYSGRSVIVIGPELHIYQCALPKRMALELFRPFVINKIIERDLAYNIRNANRLIEATGPEIWAILEEVIEDRRVLLNRAPTLHRLGVQAFKPILTEDLAIRVPALVCAAFNADFDGDQMAVHLPLSRGAQKEAREILMSNLNLLKPATGDPITNPTQDIVLGCYYLTSLNESVKGAGQKYDRKIEALYAYEQEMIDLNAPIYVQAVKHGDKPTTVGRIIFNNILPKGFDFRNETMTKKTLQKIVAVVIREFENEETVHFLDDLKRLGFQYASRSGISWGMADLIMPAKKPALVKAAEEQTVVIRQQYDDGLLTESERKARVISVWEKVRKEIAKLVPESLDPQSSVYQIIDSGARGSWSQPTQMMGMKGLVANPKNETIELPIKSSYKEGFSVLEYFISTHGARKGLTDTSLKTAQAGYLTRRLVDVAQDVVIKEDDCKTKDGIEINREDGLEFGSAFASRLFSRTVLETVKEGKKVLVKAGVILGHNEAELIDKSKIDMVLVRSPITCKALYGLCSKCYGFGLGNNKPIEKGEAVGIVAAQSIGEPGTQLTMRTFHIGGVAGSDITHGLPRIEELFEARSPKGKAFLSEIDGSVRKIEQKGSLQSIEITSSKDKETMKEYQVPAGVELLVKEGDAVLAGDQLVEGPLDLQELFKLRGAEITQKYIINEVQRIYLSEGAAINNKHIEVIVRQMFSRVKIKEPGDSDFVPGDVVDKTSLIEANREIKKSNGAPAKGEQLLLGIIKAALSSRSFLSAASFQQTARVLIAAAVEGKVDTLQGLKENVIIGRLIPVGTGFKRDAEDLEDEITEEESS